MVTPHGASQTTPIVFDSETCLSEHKIADVEVLQILRSGYGTKKSDNKRKRRENIEKYRAAVADNNGHKFGRIKKNKQSFFAGFVKLLFWRNTQISTSLKNRMADLLSAPVGLCGLECRHVG